MAVAIGAQLDNYRIVEKIGEGGMGAVYRAFDVMLERDVALKFLRPELASEPDLVDRFRAEAIVLARLNHQFIAPVYGLHRYGNDWFIAMEYVPGEALDLRLKRLTQLPPDVAMYLTSMVLQALDYAHRLGVVHRDIKPANVIVTPAGTLKVMDFGIARVLGSERRTRAGAVVGTLSYMAPEQIQGTEVDQRADLYSVGTLLYEMLSGHVPFRGDTEWQLMKAQIDEPPKPLRELVTVPDPLDAAVMKALEKQPERRFQTAAEFHFALEVAARQAGFVTDAVASGAGAPTPPPGHITGPAPSVQSWEETRVAVPTPVPIARPGSGAIPPPRVDAQTRLSTEKPATSPPAAPPPPAPVPVNRAAVPPGAKPQVLKRGQHGPTLALGTLALLALAGGLAWLVWWRQAAPPDTAPPPRSVAEQVPAAPAVSGVAGPAETAGPGASPGKEDTPTQVTAPPQPAPPAPRPGTTAGPRRPGTGTTGATPPSSATRDVAPPAVPPPARGELAKPAPPPAGAVVGTLIFHNVRLARPGSPELDVELHFEPARLLIMDETGQRILRGVPYALIVSAEYVEARRRVFVRTLRHFLVLRGPQGEVARLRLERENAAEVVSSFEQRWGKTVTRAAAQDEERP